jgi:lactate/malate dehydrogenase, alpha/beta C-terminal domain
VQAKAGKVRASVALTGSVHICESGQTADFVLMVPPLSCASWLAARITQWVAAIHLGWSHGMAYGPPSQRPCIIECAECLPGAVEHLRHGRALQGSATLSMAYAGALFADACLRGLNGDSNVVEPTFVESKITELPFFASKVRLGPSGEAAQHRQLSMLHSTLVHAWCSSALSVASQNCDVSLLTM